MIPKKFAKPKAKYFNLTNLTSDEWVGMMFENPWSRKSYRYFSFLKYRNEASEN